MAFPDINIFKKPMSGQTGTIEKEKKQCKAHKYARRFGSRRTDLCLVLRRQLLKLLADFGGHGDDDSKLLYDLDDLSTWRVTSSVTIDNFKRLEVFGWSVGLTAET